MFYNERYIFEIFTYIKKVKLIQPWEFVPCSYLLFTLQIFVI